MKNKTTKGSPNTVKLAILGASLAGLAATLAGLAATAYFFLGSKGKKHQKRAKAWAIKMKGDVVEKLEMVRDITKPVYHEIIDSVATEYKKGMKVGHEEIRALVQDLKKNWKTISNSARSAKRDVVKSTRKVVKKRNDNQKNRLTLK